MIVCFHFIPYQQVSILQYCFVKNWALIDSASRHEIQVALLEALKWCVDSPTVVSFTTRKIIQVCFLIYFRFVSNTILYDNMSINSCLGFGFDMETCVAKQYF